MLNFIGFIEQFCLIQRFIKQNIKLFLINQMFVPSEFVCYSSFIGQPLPQYYQTYWIIPQPLPVNNQIVPTEQGIYQNFYELFQQELLNRKPTFSKKIWKEAEDDILMTLYQQNFTWEQISHRIQKTNAEICKRRFLRLSEKKPKWTKEDDKIIKQMKELNKSWSDISQCITAHTMKQIRQRYDNYLRGGINIDEWELEEDMIIIKYVRTNGKKWKNLSSLITNRTQIQLKNRYYGTLMPLEKKINLQIQRK